MLILFDEIIASIWQFLRGLIFEIVWDRFPPLRYLLMAMMFFFLSLLIGGWIWTSFS